MEYLRGHDRYLDPPDPPSHSACEGCGGMFHEDDLASIDRKISRLPFDTYYCEECLEKREAEFDEN